ncbi:MAG: SLC13 family permease [Eubacteriales bacterium]
MTKKRKFYINVAISVSLMFFFRFIPPFGTMTVLGMEILGIFLGVLWAWINGEMIWSSILALIILGFTDYCANVTESFSLAIGNGIVQMILWLLVFAALLTTSGISDQLANRLVSSKLCKGHPWVLSIFIIMAAYICSALGAFMAAIIICWEFVYKICKQVGYTKEDTWTKMMLVGIVFSTAVGLVTMPFTAGVAANFGYLMAASQGLYSSYSYLSYAIFSVIFGFSIMAVYFIACKFVVNPDVSKLKDQIDIGKKIPFSKKQKLAIAAIIIMIILTFLPSILPDSSVKIFLNTIGTNAIILLVIGIVIMIRDKDGKPYFTFKELADNGIYWDILFMVATALTIGTALSVGDTGFKDLFISMFNPIFAGKSPYIFGIGIIIATLILTNFINNAVAGAIMIPIMFPFASEVGANPMTLTAIIIFISNLGLVLPSSSPFGAFLNSNKEWLSTKDIVSQLSICLFAATVTAIFIGIPLGNLVF